MATHCLSGFRYNRLLHCGKYPVLRKAPRACPPLRQGQCYRTRECRQGIARLWRYNSYRYFLWLRWNQEH